MSREVNLMSIEMDKLTETYSFKIPEILKVQLGSLTPEDKKHLNIKLMVEMAKAIHDSKFNPMAYLSTGCE